MKDRPLWRISVATTPEAEDAVAQLLQRLSGSAAVGFTNIETGSTSVSLYLSDQPDAPRLRIALANGLARIRQHGLNVGAGRISFRQLSRAEWAESWKRHFKPIEIGSRLLIRPDWSRRRARPGQSVIVINPGLGFGTGQHPTTDFCLRQLVAHRKSAGRQSFLDIGTGSGILALAAAKLGYAPIEAFDCDPEAVRIARVNARRNRVFDRIRLRRADLTKLPERSAEQFDLICANLESTLLVSQRQRILARLKPNGVLVIAGILRTEFEAVRKGLVDAGLEPLARCAEREWCSGAFSAAPGQRFSAVILAGGQSRRMGRDKAWVEINGQTLLARALATVRDAGIDEVFISGREGTAYASLGCPVLHDARPGRGPLGGIVAGLSAAHSPLLLVLAVDLARMTSAFIRKLKVHCTANTGVVPVLSGRLEPLAAIYPTRYHRVAGQLLKKSRAAHELAELCRRERAVRTVAIAPSDARFFLNCNTRADLAAARRQR